MINNTYAVEGTKLSGMEANSLIFYRLLFNNEYKNNLGIYTKIKKEAVPIIFNLLCQAEFDIFKICYQLHDGIHPLQDVLDDPFFKYAKQCIMYENSAVLFNTSYIEGSDDLYSITLLFYSHSSIILSDMTQWVTELKKYEAALNHLVKIFYYYTSTRGEIENKYFNKYLENTVSTVNYPFIYDEGNVDAYIDAYIKSNAPILLLFGAPGTGKTRFIRYLLYKLNVSANGALVVHHTTDPKIIEHSVLFARYLENDNIALVLEDIDYNLGERESGNTNMYNILGACDGLMQTKKHKMIISTNLSSTQHVDPALIRKGRCFDTIHFRPLTKEEAVKVCLAENAPADLMDLSYFKNNEYTLANVYAAINGECSITSVIDRRLGFK